MRSIFGLIASTSVVVSIVAAAKLPVGAERFPNTTVVSVVAICVAAAALIAWRILGRLDVVPNGDEIGLIDDPLRFVGRLRDAVQQLRQDARSLDSQQVCQRIDALIDHYVVPFSASRQAVIGRLGLQAGTGYVIEFSVGERMLNRAWSAAADGNLDEALASLGEAEGAFRSLSGC